MGRPDVIPGRPVKMFYLSLVSNSASMMLSPSLPLPPLGGCCWGGSCPHGWPSQLWHVPVSAPGPAWPPDCLFACSYIFLALVWLDLVSSSIALFISATSS